MLYSTYLAIGFPGGWELIVVALVMHLLFGSRLPKVAKGLGRSIVEFKKGIKGVGDDIEDASEQPSSANGSPEDKGSDLYRERREPESADGPPPPDGGTPHREKGDLSNPGESESS